MAEICLQPPDKFDFKNADDWSHWKRRFQQFRIALSLDTQSNSKQIGMLLYSMGKEAEMILSLMNISESQRESYDKVLGKLDEYFHVRHNVIFDFNRRDQMESESGDQYITELNLLSGRTVLIMDH